MIILSQDREKILNMDNINFIEVRRTEVFARTTSFIIRIGSYKDEERAKEVLREIILKNGSCNAYKIANDRQKEQIRDSFAKSFIRDNEIFDSYTMPEK